MRDVSRPHRGARILTPGTIHHMTADHLPPAVGYGPTARERFGALAPVPEMGYGFGLGFAVRTTAGRRPLPGSVGGVYGTAFWIDPTEQLIAVLMLLAPDRRLYYRHLLRPLVYGAHYRTCRLSSLVKGRRNIQCGRTA
jgi:CubicO group peptidase (beta-lactamase class C family)